MTITRGRVVKGAPAGVASASLLLQPTRADDRRAGEPRRVERTVVDAHEEAARILVRAEADALARVERVLRSAAVDAGEEEKAKLAAQFLALRHEEQRRDARDLARTVELAKILAERLLGEELRITPERIVLLAEVVLREARGARRVVIEVRAEDAEVLRCHLVELSLEGSVEVRVGDGLGPGSLVVHTDVGTLDARLEVQLERLAPVLAEALRTASSVAHPAAKVSE